MKKDAKVEFLREKNLEKAIEDAYKNVEEISFKDNYYRKDIGTLYVPVKY